MTSTRIAAIQKLSEKELQLEGKTIASATLSGRHTQTASWHNQYKNSAYIFIGGLDYRLTEGDIAIVFSQWGEPVDIHLVRDRKTGASKGFGFLAYEDQRSSILAVDNANGMELLYRRLRVDHVADYMAPVKFSDELDENGNPIQLEYKATGPEGAGIGKYKVTENVKKQVRGGIILDSTSPATSVVPLKSKFLDQDELWAKTFDETLKLEKNEREIAHTRKRHKHQDCTKTRGQKEKKHKHRRRSYDDTTLKNTLRSPRTHSTKV